MAVAVAVGAVTFLRGTGGQTVVYGAFLLYLAILTLPFIMPWFRPGVFHPLVFYVIWNCLKDLVTGKAILAATGLPFHKALMGFSQQQLNNLLAESYVLEAIALLSLYMGYLMTPPLHVRLLPNPEPRAVRVKSIFWVSVSAIGLIVLCFYAGGFTEVLMQRGIEQSGRISASIGSHWHWVAGIGIVSVILWIAYDTNATRKPIFWITAIFALFIKFAASGSRGGVILPLIMIGSIWILYRRKIPYKVIIIGAVMAVTMVGMLKNFRSETQKNNELKEVSIAFAPTEWISNALEELRSRSGSNSGLLAILGKVPEEVGYLYGESYLSLPYVFLPTAIFGEKPPAAGRLTAQRIYNRTNTAIPPGGVGEAYWNFSYLGVVLIYFLYGVFLRVIQSVFRGNHHNAILLVIYMYILLVFQPFTPSLYDFFQGIIPAILIWVTFIMNPSWIARKLTSEKMMHS
ncbi:MAG: oligosaccharide repeat unit polymerase [Chlorobiales bacterium]|nr:oligosaccharide repeat unit polymerase [Chlorobiales bacterium]